MCHEMIAMMTQYPQLHADVSTITWMIPRSAFYNHLEGGQAVCPRASHL